MRSIDKLEQQVTSSNQVVSKGRKILGAGHDGINDNNTTI